MSRPDLSDAGLRVRGDATLRRAIMFALIVAAVLAAILAALFTASDLPDIELRFAAGWAILAIAGFALTELYHATVWWRLLGRLGGELHLSEAWSGWCLSSLGRWVPTSLPLPAIRVLRAADSGVAPRITIASIAYEGAFSVLGALVVASLVLTELPFGISPLVGLTVAGVVICALQPRVFGAVANAALRRLGRERLPIVLGSHALPPFTLAFAGSFLLGGVSVYAAALALAPLDASALPAAVASFAAGFLASILVFVAPAGLGAREASMTAVLSVAMSLELALAISVATRFCQIVIELGLGGVTILWARRERERRRVRAVRAPFPRERVWGR